MVPKKLMETVLARAIRTLQGPTIVAVVSPRRDSGFDTTIASSEPFARAHMAAIALDLLRMLHGDRDETSACPACTARDARIAAAIDSLTAPDARPAGHVH